MARLTASDWLRAAWARFGREGIDGVRVEALARDLGATKGSFYWHFDGRDALRAAMLESWEAQGTDAVIASVDAVGGDAADRFRALMRTVFAGTAYAPVEAGIRTWARRDAAVRAVLDRVDGRRIAYVAALLRESGVPGDVALARAEALVRTLVGEYAVAVAGGEPLSAAALAEMADLALTRDARE